MANNYLNRLTIGGRFGKDNGQILWQCGCCDDRNLIDNLTAAGTSTAKVNITFKEEPYCHAPVCTPNDRGWETCTDDGTFVTGIKVCLFSGGSAFEERCVDPFYALPAGSSQEILSCGSCSDILYPRQILL